MKTVASYLTLFLFMLVPLNARIPTELLPTCCEESCCCTGADACNGCARTKGLMVESKTCEKCAAAAKCCEDEAACETA